MDNRDLEKTSIFAEAVGRLQDAGFKAELREQYSGRSMYGKTTPAIVTDAPEYTQGSIIVEVAIKLNYAKTKPDAEKFIPMRVDSMGLSFVYY